MTHRAFSRNASSSRAIPVERLIQDVLDDPAMPSYWGANKPGMQAGDEVDPGIIAQAETQWHWAMEYAVKRARYLARLGVHKQHVNRIIEPFAHINVLATATDWDNFFNLRDHPDAQPEIQRLARAIRAAMLTSAPEHLAVNEWHTPYVSRDEIQAHGNHIALKVSAARCASVSYKTVDGQTMTVDKALRVCDKLLGDPMHASPFEHIAKPCRDNDKRLTRNFTGWAQYRAILEG
jgi:thymidylate synthase ThyX